MKHEFPISWTCYLPHPVYKISTGNIIYGNKRSASWALPYYCYVAVKSGLIEYLVRVTAFDQKKSVVAGWKAAFNVILTRKRIPKNGNKMIREPLITVLSSLQPLSTCKAPKSKGICFMHLQHGHNDLKYTQTEGSEQESKKETYIHKVKGKKSREKRKKKKHWNEKIGTTEKIWAKRKKKRIRERILYSHQVS